MTTERRGGTRAGTPLVGELGEARADASSNRRTPWLLYVVTILSAAPLGALVAWQSPRPQGACSGIGFGCGLYGWDAAAVALVLYGVPYAVVLGAGLGVLMLARSPRSRSITVVIAALGLAVPWALVGALVVS